MRNATYLIALLTLLVVGCASTQTTAGKLLASTAVSADAGMKAWAIWVANGQATPAQEVVVKSAYEKYQASMAIASAAYTQLATTTDKTAWQSAASVLQANQTALLNLITQFQTSTHP